MNRGVFYATATYVMWGSLPIYWKALSSLPGLETTAHRVVWSALFTALLLTMQRNWRWLGRVIKQPRLLITLVAISLLLLANWLIYIYAVNHNQILESSLGYFINPLVNVLLGIVFLRERPRMWQWVAIAVATAGVAYLTYSYGSLPWIALGLAASFGFYALLKKSATLPSIEGFFIETTILAVPLGLYLLLLAQRGQGSFGHTDWQTTTLLLLAGPVTAIPLILFSAGAKRVPMTLLGLLQYISPSISFILSIVLFHEPFSHTQLIGFSFIWVALAIFTLESTIGYRRLQPAAQ